MSSLFETYLQLGFTHIADIKAYDHILFVIALCAIYRVEEWRKVAVLVTAFTLGHSLTLALAVLDVISFSRTVIELLIPVTILITCAYNIYAHRSPKIVLSPLDAPRSAEKQHRWIIPLNYWFALIFGLIHGMGFSNFLRSIQMPGQDSSILWELLSFNLGIELGQLLIVGLILIVSFLAFTVLKINQRNWVIVLSTIVGIFALQLLIKQLL